jgi:hypothetical protein
MSSFCVIKNPEGTYRIECQFVVYREKFGRHPKFLKGCEGNARDGFNTKFWFLVEDDLDKEEAKRKLVEYQTKYDELIISIENDDTRWEEFPFKDNVITYSK